MNDKCYAELMKEMRPLLEKLLSCQSEQEAPHTRSGQFKREHMLAAPQTQGSCHGQVYDVTTSLTCPDCKAILKGQFMQRFGRIVLYCPTCLRARYWINEKTNEEEAIDKPLHPWEVCKK